MCNQRNECKSVLGASAINRTSITPFVSTNVPTSQPISVCIHAYTYVFIYFAILTLGHENRRFDRPTCCNSLTGRRSIVTVLHLFFARGSDVRIGGHEFQVRSVRPEVTRFILDSIYEGFEIQVECKFPMIFTVVSRLVSFLPTYCANDIMKTIDMSYLFVYVFLLF